MTETERSHPADEPPTCGQGLAAHAAVPQKMAELLKALAGTLAAHLPTIDAGDPAGRQEKQAYEHLVSEYAAVGDRLASAAERMRGYRDLPPAVELELAAPVLSVTDLSEALEFYRDILGFGVAWTWGSPAEMAAVHRGDVEIHLQAAPEPERHRSSRIYCFVRGVDRLAADVKASGGRILNEVADQPYGMRDFDLDDPSGNRICFGEPTTE